MSKQDAVKGAVLAERQRMAEANSLRDRLASYHANHPMPLATGLPADKAFFDELSGEPE